MFVSINPTTEDKLESFDFITNERVLEVINSSQSAYEKWRMASIGFRADCIRQIGTYLFENKEELSELITTEIGKPLKQSVSEIEKCAVCCTHFAGYAEEYLSSEEKLSSTGQNAKLIYQPLGVIYGIMPWNFPLWQVVRFAIPTLLAGNTVIVKHAPNSGIVASRIESIFSEFLPENVYQNVFSDVTQTELFVSHPGVKGVSLTGSNAAGKAVGEMVGKYMKRLSLIHI